MSLSKPIYSFLGFYFEQLFNHPLRTKSITSSVIATSGALVSQSITGSINPRNLAAYGAFAGLIGAPVAHYFYNLISFLVPTFRNARLKPFLEFLIERLAFAPLFVGLSLYFLSLFEGKSPDEATANLLKLYKSVLLANYRYLTLPVFLNFNFVPPMLRVFVSNIIGFFWIIYISDKRRRAAAAAKKNKEG